MEVRGESPRHVGEADLAARGEGPVAIARRRIGAAIDRDLPPVPTGRPDLEQQVLIARERNVLADAPVDGEVVAVLEVEVLLLAVVGIFGPNRTPLRGDLT